jgi:hypothetical protein
MVHVYHTMVLEYHGMVPWYVYMYLLFFWYTCTYKNYLKNNLKYKHHGTRVHMLGTSTVDAFYADNAH